MSEHCREKLHEHLRKAVASQLLLEQETKAGGQRPSSDTTSLPPPPSLADAVQAAHGAGALPTEGVPAALVEAFLSIDKELLEEGSASCVGTTAVVALLGRDQLWVANCGEGESCARDSSKQPDFFAFTLLLLPRDLPPLIYLFVHPPSYSSLRSQVTPERLWPGGDSAPSP